MLLWACAGLLPTTVVRAGLASQAIDAEIAPRCNFLRA